LYSNSFWRVVRKKGLWLKPASLMRWFLNNGANELHRHSADAVVQSFFAFLQSWRRRRQADPNAQPPRRRRRYFKVIWKSSTITIGAGIGRPKMGVCSVWCAPRPRPQCGAEPEAAGNRNCPTRGESDQQWRRCVGDYPRRSRESHACQIRRHVGAGRE